MLAALVFASVAVALGLAPWRRPMTASRCRIVRTGVATDYCVQTLGCTLEDAVRAEAKMLPQVANSVRRDKAEVVCAELRAKLGLSDHEMRKLVLRVPTVLTCVEIKILRRVRAESSRRPPRHRRDACSMAWRCRFLAARPSQDGRVIAEK